MLDIPPAPRIPHTEVCGFFRSHLQPRHPFPNPTIPHTEVCGLFRSGLQQVTLPETENLTHGSVWIVQIQPTTAKETVMNTETHPLTRHFVTTQKPHPRRLGWMLQIQPVRIHRWAR